MRREYEHGIGTIKGVARKFGVHRRMVREAIAGAVPERKAGHGEDDGSAFCDEIARASRAKGDKFKGSVPPLYRKLLEITGRVMEQAKRFSAEIASGVKRSFDVLKQAALEGLRREMYQGADGDLSRVNRFSKCSGSRFSPS